MSILEFCRVCADFSDNTSPLFAGSLRKLIPKIKDITGLQLKNIKDLPQNICKSCEKQTVQAHEFREFCIRAQKRLELLCQQNNEETLRSKRKSKSHKDYIHKETSPIEEVICNRINEFKTELTDEEEDKLPLKQEPTNSDDNSKGSSNFLADSDIRVPDVLSIEPETSLHTTESNKPAVKTSESKSAEKYKRPEHNYICDQCGKHYTVKHLFQMHMLRHTGIRPYPCKLCSKGYYATNDLRRHMFKHTGERPYQCKYCALTFNDKSHLLIHTRREHTHERPFVCDQCQKSFISSCTYRTHLTTHSGVRAFTCKLCNVSYKRQCHLKRHSLSVLHKQKQEKHAVVGNQITAVPTK